MRKLIKNKQAYTKIVGSLVALLLMIIVGVLVFWETSESITLGNDDANTTKNTTTDMASTVFGLLPIVALVIVAGIIISVIMGFGGGRKGL